MKSWRQIAQRRYLAEMRASAMRYREHIHPDSQYPGYFGHNVKCAAASVEAAILYRDLARPKGGGK